MIKEKFEDEESRTMDLSTFLAKKTGLPRLNLHLFMPIGETKAWQILRMLSAQDEARKKNSK